MLRKCCGARTSVGARMADCPPASTTCSMPRRAHTVLPEPTSPCSSRCIGCESARSAAISAPTWRCPAVSSYGSAASNAASRPPPRCGRDVAGAVAARILRCTRDTCTARASSNASLARAAWSEAKDAGGWISRERGRERHQAPRAAQLDRYRIRRRAQCRQRVPHAPGDRPGPYLLGRRVDRDQGARERVQSRVVVAEQHVLRVRQLALAVEFTDRTGEQADPTRRQLAGPPVGHALVLGEEGQRERVTLVVGHRHVRHEAPTVAEPARVGRPYRGLDRDIVTDVQARHVGQLAPLLVPAREVVDQVAHGTHAEGLLELLPPFAHDGLERPVQCAHSATLRAQPAGARKLASSRALTSATLRAQAAGARKLASSRALTSATLRAQAAGARKLASSRALTPRPPAADSGAGRHCTQWTPRTASAGRGDR